MDLRDGALFVVFLIVLTLLVKPIGLYLCHVLNPHRKTWLDWILKPVEKRIYRLCGIEVNQEQTWKEYVGSILAFSLVSLVLTYLLLQFQHLFPLNPQNFGPLSWDLSFNTAVSFMTNTNWQSYGGESTMSYFSQMVALVLQNFLSAAVGIAAMSVLVRSLSRSGHTTVGNFWVDLIRINLYLLLPLAAIFAALFISQGVPQNFDAYTQVEGGGLIVQGPIASQEAIKLLGTNGGGYTNVNSAHPYENPTSFANFLQMLALMLIPAGQTYYFGREVSHQKHGWSLYAAMVIIFTAGVILCGFTEEGNMEGKEVRFGTFGSALFAAATTSTSCGAVNSMHDSYTPIGGLVPMLNMELSEVVFGGVGAGLYSILLFVLVTIFMAGLMIGRTPEYLGKKIEAFEIKYAFFALIIFFVVVLGFAGWGVTSSWGIKALGNSGPHGFSEILYAYSSSAANNGSAFAGLSANTPWYNVTLAVVMLCGRFLVMIPVLVIAGSFTQKTRRPTDPSSFPVSGTTFTLLLIGVIVVIGALAFLPGISLGPIVEQLFMSAGKLF